MNAAERQNVNNLVAQAKQLRAKAAQERNSTKRAMLLRQVDRLMEIAGTYTPTAATNAGSAQRTYTPAEKAALRRRLDVAMQASKSRRQMAALI